VETMYVSGKCAKRELIAPYMDCQVELSETVVYLDYTHSRQRYIFHCGVRNYYTGNVFYVKRAHITNFRVINLRSYAQILQN